MRHPGIVHLVAALLRVLGDAITSETNLMQSCSVHNLYSANNLTTVSIQFCTPDSCIVATSHFQCCTMLAVTLNVSNLSMLSPSWLRA